MDIEKKIELIARPPTEEILTADGLKELLETNDHPGHYIGYEVSGKLHLGSLILSGFKVNDMLKAGVKCQAYFAHYHSLINNKLGGNWENLIKASEYYAEAFAEFCPGLKIVQATDLYHHNDEFWMNVLKFSKHMTMNRAVRCLPIMGRTEKETMDLGSMFYAPMQAVDIKTIGADIAHAGMDQRSAHILAREIYPKMGWKKPVCVHHHLLPGLTEPAQAGRSKEEKTVAAKMTKSKPETCLFVHDSEAEIKTKLNKAWCPDKIVEANPVTEMVKYIVFHEKECFDIERPAKFGGDLCFESYEAFETAYTGGKLHPADLKSAVAKEINEIIKPVREHFEKPKFAKMLDVYKEAKITR
ncbi:MAG: tyrosine--tRNA ligase [Candidatus Micrarchaeota archaeon]